jgi:hypothetical protein
LHETTDVELAPAVEAIAAAAAEWLRAHTDGDEPREAQRQQMVQEAASRAISAGVSLSAIADAERIGHIRAREELCRDVLRVVERAAQRKRDSEQAYDRAVLRGARLGLSHRDIAGAAQVAHGTVRATLARAQNASCNSTARTNAVPIMEAGARDAQESGR